jgi:hypothetical protein
MPESPQTVLSAAVARLLRPLVRLLLRHGVSYGTFADIAKQVFVGVATEDFALKGRKQSVSRVSLLTGLTRKEVARIQELPPPQDREIEEQHNRAARVIGGWLRDPDFLDADGAPLPLPIDKGEHCFAALVRRHSGDVPVRAVLDELLRVGAVDKVERGRIRLRTRGYVPQASAAEKLHMLGTDVEALIATIDHNLDPESKEPLLQRKVMYDNLPDEVLEALRRRAARQGQELLLALNDWMAEHDRDATPDVKGTGRNRAGVGVYYFEAPVDPEDPEK